MKEKFDLSLDNRQIVSLLIASIVVMGAVFVLGVVVGKKLAGNAQTAAAQDLLSALASSAERRSWAAAVCAFPASFLPTTTPSTNTAPITTMLAMSRLTI